MALPNYSPDGTILFGGVPWDNGYSHVRAYESLEVQYQDIAGMMDIQSDNYVYIGRDRRLKVDIEADRLYHCNYCMYRNKSLTTGWIYCFISDITYINDHTTEVTLETDVFQTYLMNTDWTLPACFIERETVPSEDSRYLLTNEPDFPLVYEVDEQVWKRFGVGGFCVMSGTTPKQNSNAAEDVINPTGWYGTPAPLRIINGIPNGASMKFFELHTTTGGHIIYEDLETELHGLTQAGAVESVVSVFTVPEWAKAADFNQVSLQDPLDDWASTFTVPEWGTSLGSYVPENRKMLYYPYTFCRLTDFNGSTSDLRYELLSSRSIAVKWMPSPACKAYVYPLGYRGIEDLDAGFPINCGTPGSWSNNQFQTWVAQNSASIALTIAGVALAGVSGGTSLAAASSSLRAANGLRGAASLASRKGAANLTKAADWALERGAAQKAAGMKSLEMGAAGAAAGAATLSNASKQPTLTRGEITPDVQFGTGIQGVAAQRICCKPEVAQQIDQWFKRWGYAVERIELPRMYTRQTFNYCKTGGAAARSRNVAAGDEPPFRRGRGTPASALAVINAAFDGGVTFWHTTEGFGDYSLPNPII